MVRAYLLENPAESVSIEDLAKLNVFYAKIDVNNYEKPLGKICEERNYKNRDFVSLYSNTDLQTGYTHQTNSWTRRET